MKRTETGPWSRWLANEGTLGDGFRAVAILMVVSAGLIVMLFFWAIVQLILTFFFWAVLVVAALALAVAGAFGALRAVSRRRAIAVPIGQEIPSTSVAEQPASAGPVFQETVLAATDIFRDLSREQLALVAERGRMENFREGDVLGVQGSRGECVYCIVTGQIQLQTVSPMGNLTVRIANAGESWPLAALISDGSLITSAISLNDLGAIVIPRDTLLELLMERPDIGRKVYKAIAEILGGRYRSSLKRMTEAMDRALQHAEIWANV